MTVDEAYLEWMTQDPIAATGESKAAAFKAGWEAALREQRENEEAGRQYPYKE